MQAIRYNFQTIFQGRVFEVSIFKNARWTVISFLKYGRYKKIELIASLNFLVMG